MKARAELDERRNAARYGDRAARRPRDAGHQLQRGALAGAVPPDDAVGLPRRHHERDILQRRKFFLGPQILDQAARQQRALERGELLPPRIAAIDLRDVSELNRLHKNTRSSPQKIFTTEDTEEERRILNFKINRSFLSFS